jgi:transglutaminase-like putative cysteine protease
MSVLRHCRFRSLVLAALSLAALSLAERNTAMLAGSLLLCAASWYALEGPRGRPLPRWAAGVCAGAVVIVAVTAGADAGSLADLIAITGRGLGAVLVIMLFSRQRTVDERSVIALSSGVLVASCMLSTGLLVGIAVAAATVAAVVAVTSYRLAAGSEEAAVARRMPPHAHVSAPPPEVSLRSVPSLRGVAVASSALVLLVASVVFLVFPRLWRDQQGLFRRGGPGTTGFAPEIRLRAGDRISTSRREVFVVRWLDSAGQAARFAGTPYLRGAVLDAYDTSDARWRSASANPAQITFRIEPGTFSNLGNPPIDTRVDTWTQVVEMRALVTDTMFTAWAPASVSATAPRTVVLEPATGTLRDLGADDAGRYSTYQVKVRPYPSASVLASLSWGQEPAPSPQGFPVPAVRDEAATILREMGLAGDEAPIASDSEARWARARRIAGAFDSWMQPPRFRYTTDLSRFIARDGRDPIELFLREYRFGHCELYASAMAALCQSVGVDARVVVGYIALEYDELAGVYVVRESNAHAWVEVLTGPQQWSMYDPTPAADLIALHEAGRTWADAFRWLYDPIDFAWTRSVVAFDGTRQARLADSAARKLGDAFGDVWRELGAWAQRVNNAFLLGPAGYIWIGSLGAVAVVGVWAAVSVTRARRRERALLALGPLSAADRARMRRDAQFWVDAVVSLRRAGIARPDHMTPVAWAGSVRDSHPEVSAMLERIALRLYAIRFGGERPDAAARRADAQLAQDLFRAAARRHAG